MPVDPINVTPPPPQVFWVKTAVSALNVTQGKH